MKNPNQTGLLVPLSQNEIARIEKLAAKRRETPERWLLLAVLGCLETDEEDAAFEAGSNGGGDLVLKIPKKTAARLKRAAAFEEMSVADYLKDGIRRDLDLTDDLMESQN
jgi:hypothetical protein